MKAFRTLGGAGRRRFLAHYLEMVVVMVVGMAVLGPLESWLAPDAWWSGLRAVPELDALVMATNMTVAMVAWMRLRGHRWVSTVEMAVVMYLAFAVLVPPLRLGLLSSGAFLGLGHTLMFVAMVGVMLRRAEEYAGQHDARRGVPEETDRPAANGPGTSVQAERSAG